MPALLAQNPVEDFHRGATYSSMRHQQNNTDLMTETFPPKLMKASQNDIFSQNAVVSVEDPAESRSYGRNTSDLMQAQNLMSTNPA